MKNHFETAKTIDQTIGSQYNAVARDKTMAKKTVQVSFDADEKILSEAETVLNENNIDLAFALNFCLKQIASKQMVAFKNTSKPGRQRKARLLDV